MVRFKHWARDVVSKIDGLIVQIENHENSITSALRAFEQGVARSRLQLERVKRDGESLRQSLAEERDGAQRWRERARREADEPQGLECLRRSKRAARLALELERRVGEHEGVEQQLERDVRRIERRLLELRAQAQAIRTRESRASAYDALPHGREPGVFGVAFERWEAQVAESEIASGCLTADLDELDDEYMTREEEAVLVLELRELKEETR